MEGLILETRGATFTTMLSMEGPTMDQEALLDQFVDRACLKLKD